MPPRRTRQSTRSQAKSVNNHTQGLSNGGHDVLQSSTNAHTTLRSAIDSNLTIDHGHNGKKRTFSYDTEVGASSANLGTEATHDAAPAKKARTAPISDTEMATDAEEEGHDDGVVVGKRQQLQRTFSFYPGRGDTGNTFLTTTVVPATTVVPGNDQINITDGESEVESMTDWLEPLDEPGPALRRQSKTLDAMAVERPSWQVSGPSAPEVTKRASNTQAVVDTSQAGSKGKAKLEPTWPADTELQFIPGSVKITLTAQRPLVRVVIQDAMELVHADMLFNCAFPDPAVTLVAIKTSLLTAASRYPGAVSIYRRLMCDEWYIEKITPLPRARMPLFRSEVKERCAAIVAAEFLAITSDQIQSSVSRQLSRYNYTFPVVSGNVASNASLVRCTQPYRNDRIIRVIRDLYFMGGLTSFAKRFEPLFPTHLGLNGVVTCEVPIPMVALVATALYAALYEWRTGALMPMGFSANAFLDVYQGHVNTFQHIRDQRSASFHTMMADIYSRACSATNGAAVPIADLALEELDG